MKKIIIIVLVAILPLIVGCKKKEIVRTDTLNVSLAESEIPSGGQAFFRGYMSARTFDFYNYMCHATSGYITVSSSTFADEFTTIYKAPVNSTQYRILVSVSAHVYIDDFSTTKSVDAFVLPVEEEEEQTKGKGFKYIDLNERTINQYLPGKPPIVIEDISDKLIIDTEIKDINGKRVEVITGIKMEVQ